MAFNLAHAGAVLGTLSAGGMLQAADKIVTKGPDLGGIAAIIAASAGMISALGAIALGWRSKSSNQSDIEKELLMKLLEKQLSKDDDE